MSPLIDTADSIKRKPYYKVIVNYLFINRYSNRLLKLKDSVFKKIETNISPDKFDIRLVCDFISEQKIVGEFSIAAEEVLLFDKQVFVPSNEVFELIKEIMPNSELKSLTTLFNVDWEAVNYKLIIEHNKIEEILDNNELLDN
jgi:hypothetical protein